MRSRRTAVVVVVAGLLALAACAGDQASVGTGAPAERGLGEPYKTTTGLQVHLMRVQDEYRLIRRVKEGQIQADDDVFKISRETITDEPGQSGVRWNTWVPVPSVPGLEIKFLSQDRFAFRERGSAQPR
jgi:hypothetical protein